MTISTEFIVDQIKVAPMVDDVPNVIALIRARWKITDDRYPGGFAYHGFYRAYDVMTEVDYKNFTNIENVTDAMIEQWCTAGMTPEQREAILNAAEPQILASHREAQLTTHYQNPDVVWSPT